MASTMPLIPRILFQYIEPVSLFGGLFVAWYDVDDFINGQYESSNPVSKLVSNSVNAKMLALQLGNCYGLLGLLAVMVYSLTSEPKVIKGWLFACLVADVTHVGVTVLLMGEKALDVANWNALAWGNIGFTAFLFTMRTLYFMGAFGEHPSPVKAGKKRA